LPPQHENYGYGSSRAFDFFLFFRRPALTDESGWSALLNLTPAVRGRDQESNIFFYTRDRKAFTETLPLSQTPGLSPRIPVGASSQDYVDPILGSCSPRARSQVIRLRKKFSPAGRRLSRCLLLPGDGNRNARGRRGHNRERTNSPLFALMIFSGLSPPRRQLVRGTPTWAVVFVFFFLFFFFVFVVFVFCVEGFATSAA